MKTPRRTALALAGVAVSSVLLVTACGGAAPADNAEPAAPSGPVELKVNLFGTFGYDKVGLFEKYEAENPGVTITYESTQFEDKYWPALQTRLTAGSGVGDVQGIEVGRIADVVTNQPQLWTDLRDTPAADRIDDFIPWKQPAATTKDGAVLGLGTDIGPMGICYRSDLLGQAGLPTEPAALAARMTSWDAYIALGNEFKAKAPAGTAWTDFAGGLYNAMVSTEKKIYYDESGKLIYDSNPAVKKAFDTAAAAGQAGLTAKLEQFNDPGWDAAFTSGGFATIACPSWMIGYIKDKAGDATSGKWNVTTLPGGMGGNWGGSYLGIPEVSEHKEEAGKLIAWLTAPEQQAKLFEEVGNFPSNAGAIDTVKGAKDTYFSNAPIGEIFSTSAKAAPIQILGPNDGVVRSALSKALLSVETNAVSPADAWTNAAQQIATQVE